MIDPCGAVMDILRSCYSTQMVFWEGPGGSAQVEWYFVPDTTPALTPGRHLYGSSIWDTQGPAMLGPGENVLDQKSYSKGASPGIPDATSGSCTPPQWWTEGVPVGSPPLTLNADGNPACCYGQTCQPFYDGSLPQNATLHDSWTGLTWVLFFQDQGDVEFFDPSFSWFVDVEANGSPCGALEGTFVPPLSWTLPGIPTADECRFVSYDGPSFTGTYQFYAAGVPIPHRFLFFTLPPP